MSWSVRFAGTPEVVIDTLNEFPKVLINHTARAEYEAALPHLVGLVKLNIGTLGRQIEITANGHSLVDNTTCTVRIQEHDPLV